MSDSMVVFIRSEKLPSVNGLRDLLKSKGLELESWEEEGIDKLEEIEGFWPGIYKSLEAGFEFFAGEVDDDDLENWEIEKSSLEGRDLVVDLAFYEELDVVASVLCAAVLCKECDGLTFDDNEELAINHSNCDKWSESIVSSIVK